MIDPKKWLPIGSVVLLQNAQKKLMITGYLPTTTEDGEEKTFDYISVLYPEGVLSSNTNFLFNHEDINDIIFTGYENPERNNFIEIIGTTGIDQSGDSE